MRRLAVVSGLILFGFVFAFGGYPAPEPPAVREFVLGDGMPAYLWTAKYPEGDTSSVFRLRDAQKLAVDLDTRRIRLATEKESVFGLYLYEKNGRYGLRTENEVSVVAPDFDEIRVVFQYVGTKGEWMLFPVFMVRLDRQYAFVNADGSFVTRYVSLPEQLSEAMLLTPSDRFDLYQKIPFEYWGY